MSSRNLIRVAVVVPLGCLLLLSACEGGREVASLAVDGRTDVAAWQQPVPQAECGPDDATENGLQGQVTKEDRQSGRSQQAYNCNLVLFGQYQGEGASWQHAWHEDCAYYGTANRPEQEQLGTVVIDASDPATPRPTAFLTEPAMLDPWESLKVNPFRRLLAGIENGGPGFAIYDVFADCTQPQLLASVDLPDALGHSGNFAADGLTYYGTGQPAEGGRRLPYVIDVRDPTNPQQIAPHSPFPDAFTTHDLSTNDAGTRAYLAQIGNVSGIPRFGEDNGLAIFDVSEIQNRVPDPQVRLISTNYWKDGSVAQMTQTFRIGGVPYVLHADELGSGGLEGHPRACEKHLPPFAFARIIDISDETRPTIVSKLMLETHDPNNCDAIMGDDDTIFVYDAHYCTVDNPQNAEVVACGYQNSGFRVFDIRDPHRPKEIAYYIPPAQPDKRDELNGSQHTARAESLTADWASAHVRLVKERGELWSTSQDNGFQILRFTNGVWPFPED